MNYRNQGVVFVHGQISQAAVCEDFLWPVFLRRVGDVSRGRDFDPSGLLWDLIFADLFVYAGASGGEEILFVSG